MKKTKSAYSTKKPRVVSKGKKPPKSGVKQAAKTDLQKALNKWPPKG